MTRVEGSINRSMQVGRMVFSATYSVTYWSMNTSHRELAYTLRLSVDLKATLQGPNCAEGNSKKCQSDNIVLSITNSTSSPMDRDDETTNKRGETSHHLHNPWCVWELLCVERAIHGVGLPKAIWEYQSSHQGSLPNDIQYANELQTIANTLLANADVNKQVITTMPQDLIEYVYITWVASSGDLTGHITAF